MRGDDFPVIVSVDPHIGKDVTAAAILFIEGTLLFLVVRDNRKIAKDTDLDVLQIHGLDGIYSRPDILNGLLLGIWFTIGTHSDEIICHHAIENLDILLNDRVDPSLFQETDEFSIAGGPHGSTSRNQHQQENGYDHK